MFPFKSFLEGCNAGIWNRYAIVLDVTPFESMFNAVAAKQRAATSAVLNARQRITIGEALKAYRVGQLKLSAVGEEEEEEE